MAEEVGFEPTDLSVYGFQDRRLRPLGHSSKKLNAGEIHESPLPDYLINSHIIDQGFRYYNRTVFLLEILKYCR